MGIVSDGGVVATVVVVEALSIDPLVADDPDTVEASEAVEESGDGIESSVDRIVGNDDGGAGGTGQLPKNVAKSSTGGMASTVVVDSAPSDVAPVVEDDACSSSVDDDKASPVVGDDDGRSDGVSAATGPTSSS